MHIALNAWFWDRPDTGSGQYLHALTAALMKTQADLQLTLISPHETLDGIPGGVAVHPIPLHGSGHLAKLRFEQQDVPAAAGELGADLLHVPYWAAPLRSPIPVVVTIHDIIPLLLPAYRGGLLPRAYTSLVAATARGTSAIITDSDASKTDIIERLGIPAERIHAIWLAAGIKYHPRPGSLIDTAIQQKYNLPDDYVLYLGGFDVRKNVHTLLKAYTYIQQGVGDQVPLVIAGKLPETITPRLLDIPMYLNMMELDEAAVRLIGFVEEADKPALYRMAKVFVFPSRYEGFGLPVLEAMACGTPVVTTDTSSLAEIVGDGGFVVQPDDARHMAGATLSMLVQDDLHEEMSQKARARADQFKWEKTAQETLAVYQRVIGQ